MKLLPGSLSGNGRPVRPTKDRTASRPRLAARPTHREPEIGLECPLVVVAAASRDGSRSGGSVRMHSPELISHQVKNSRSMSQ